MRKTVISFALCAMLFALCFSAQAQQTGKVFRIGYLDQSTASGSEVLWESFRQEMRKLGWVEGKNITIEYRFAEQKSERLPELAADLVRLKVDLIVVASTPPALAAKNATTAIPIVMANVGDPVGAGLVASLARPGDNVTGNASLTGELNSKRLEVLKDVVPRLARVGLLRASGVFGEHQFKELRPAALALKLKLEEIETQLDPKGLESAFKTAKQKQVGAIMMQSTRPFFAERRRIVELAGKYRLPAIYPRGDFVDSGGLISYGPDQAERFRRVVAMVDKILKGTKPADIPVEQPTKFEFVINLKTANQIGVTIPQSVLYRADKVIR